MVRVGGSSGFHPRLPNEIASTLSEKEAEKMVDCVFDYSDHADQGEKLGLYIDRIGFDTFKNGVMTYFEERE